MRSPDQRPCIKGILLLSCNPEYENHFGSILNARILHPKIDDAIPALNNLTPIKEKTRLIVIDALFGCWGSNRSWFILDFSPNSLIISKDPVAADYIGAEIILEEQLKHNLKIWERVVYLDKAAEMGLGTNDPKKMELIRFDLSVSQKDNHIN